VSARSARPAARFDDVLKIAVLRGGGLGDLIFAFPAIDALAAAYPEAEIVLLGTSLHRRLLAGRPGPVARVEELPRVPGVHGPDDGVEDVVSAQRFVRRMRAERFDLACQLHGGGRNSNPFLARLNAAHTIGTRTPDAPPLERALPYLYFQHEVARWLETVALAGARPVRWEPRLFVSDAERRDARALFAGDRERLVVVHPGATDPRRRWPAERFAEVAARCAEHGARVLVIGDESEAALAETVAVGADRRVPGSVASLAGRLDMADLPGLIAAADVFVGNDSGPRHLAQAVDTPTASVFWAGNMINGGPMTRGRHRVQISWTTHCPVCGRDATQVGWTAERCAHDVSFVADVSTDALYDDVRDLLSAA